MCITLSLGEIMHNAHHNTSTRNLLGLLQRNDEIYFEMSREVSDEHIARTAMRYMWSEMLRKVVRFVGPIVDGKITFLHLGSGAVEAGQGAIRQENIRYC